MMERVRVCEPVPHDLVQVVQAENALAWQWIGHGPWSQANVPVAEPGQSAPPCFWPWQVRVPVRVPAAQLVEQVPYVQPDQTPSTGHAWVLQVCDEVVEPTQSLPP